MEYYAYVSTYKKNEIQETEKKRIPSAKSEVRINTHRQETERKKEIIIKKATINEDSKHYTGQEQLSAFPIIISNTERPPEFESNMQLIKRSNSYG